MYILGLEFVTNHWIEISELGAFDSSGDGFTQTVTVRLWSLHDRKMLVARDFAPESPGRLDGSIRYKSIPPLRIPKVCVVRSTKAYACVKAYLHTHVYSCTRAHTHTYMYMHLFWLVGLQEWRGTGVLFCMYPIYARLHI